MHEPKKCKPLTRFDVNRRLCAKVPPVRTQHDLLDPFGRHRAPVRDEYLRMCEEFKQKAKRNYEENSKVLHGNGVRLGPVISEDTVVDAPVHVDPVNPENSTKDDCLILRQRTRRSCIHVSQKSNKPLISEAWTMRHISLCRFIEASRKIIIKNRFLKNLARLRSLTPKRLQEFEDTPISLPEGILFVEVFRNFLR